jgi:type II secretory pathway pseudopilin PulG
VVVLVVAMALAITVATGLVRQLSDRRNTAEQQLADVQDAIDQIRSLQTANPDAMQERLDGLLDDLAVAWTGMPTSAEAATGAGPVLRVRPAVQHPVVEHGAVPGDELPEDQQAFTWERYLLTVRGRVPDLLAFFERITGSDYDSIVIDNLSVTSDTETTAEADLYVYYTDLSSGELPSVSDQSQFGDQATPADGTPQPTGTVTSQP